MLVRIRVTAILLFIIACILTYAPYRLHSVLPYYDLLQEEPKVVERLRTLNRNLLAQLPAPDGVTEESASDGDGGTYHHGTYLAVSYTITTSAAEVVHVYYNQMFASNGWVNVYSRIVKPDPELTFRREIYYKDTSCVSLTIHSDNYLLIIWHDFQSEASGLEMPPLEYMQSLEFGETQIDTCP